VTTVPSDIAIAQAAKLRPIAEVAAEVGLGPEDILPYGRYKAKISAEAIASRKPKGRLVLVTGINPTPAGEGKSTVTVGVSQALRRLGKKVVVCIREPSLGPVFGVKGGAAGGGYAQVVPMDEINLHFTGDFHAITSAHNLLSAMLDNHLHQGNALGIDSRRITWPLMLASERNILLAQLNRHPLAKRHCGPLCSLSGRYFHRRAVKEEQERLGICSGQGYSCTDEEEGLELNCSARRFGVWRRRSSRITGTAYRPERGEILLQKCDQLSAWHLLRLQLGHSPSHCPADCPPSPWR
jgi:hypothetical protein